MVKKNILLKVWMWVVALLVALAIGGSFVDELYMNTTILKIFPLFVHQFVGWTIIVSTIIGAIMDLNK